MTDKLSPTVTDAALRAREKLFAACHDSEDGMVVLTIEEASALAMHSPVAVCEICDTPELCRSGKCPCGLCGEFVAPASTDIANDLLAKVRASPAPTGGVVTDAMIEAGDAALKKLDFATWERMAPGEGQDFIRAILEAALTASGNSGAMSDDLRAELRIAQQRECSSWCDPSLNEHTSFCKRWSALNEGERS